MYLLVAVCDQHIFIANSFFEKKEKCLSHLSAHPSRQEQANPASFCSLFKSLNTACFQIQKLPFLFPPSFFKKPAPAQSRLCLTEARLRRINSQVASNRSTPCLLHIFLIIVRIRNPICGRSKAVEGVTKAFCFKIGRNF